MAKRVSSPLTDCVTAMKQGAMMSGQRKPVRSSSSRDNTSCCAPAAESHGNKHSKFCANYSELDAHLDPTPFPTAQAALSHCRHEDTVRHETYRACVDCGEIVETFEKPQIAATAKPSDPAPISKAADALRFILAGNALFTLRSKKTGTRYTYKVQMVHDDISKPPVWFVRLLSGPDNTNDYQYLGMIKRNQFQLTSKSRMKMDSAPVVAIAWTMDKLVKGIFHEQLEMWHEGRCGRCGRVLTVPESIERGIGPDCADQMGGF